MKPYYLALALAIVATGCSKGSNSPEAVALKYYSLASERVWDSTVTFVDTKSLEGYQRQMNNALHFLDTLRVHAPGFIERDSLLTVLYGLHTQPTSPHDFYRSFLRLIMSPQGAFGNATKPAFVPLGDVEEGTDTVHVVSKVVLANDPPNANRLLLLTLVKSPGGWKVLLPSEMFNNSMTKIVQMARQVEKTIITQNSTRVGKPKK